MRTLITLCVFALGLALPAAGQKEEAQVDATLSTGVVKLGEKTSIVISIERPGGGAA